MNAFVFPGQGAQFPGMGKDLFENSSAAQKRFHQANEILGIEITQSMFGDDAEALKKLK
jgi:[acyl-carrier-protein] S-malonyltransferase